MKKILFFTLGYSSNAKKSGIEKKIENQYKAFQSSGYIVFLTEYQNNIFKIESRYQCKIPNILLRSYLVCRLLEKFIFENEVDIIYIRYEHFSDIFFIELLKKIREKKIKILLEIPTYPYDFEYRKKCSLSYLKLFIDKIYRVYLKKYVDFIVTYSDDETIFGVPCINISNGINLKEVNLIDNNRRNLNEIVFTSVSSCYFWHGIDRMIQGIENFYEKNQTEKIIFNIVGNGPEVKALKKKVEMNLILKNKVNFLGFCSGTELEKIYNNTNIAVGSLARHRSGVNSMKALKNREYCAKGLPMIFSEDDPDFINVPFVYHVSPTEETINIENIIKWYKQLQMSPRQIRGYCEKLSWDIQIKKIIDTIEK